MCIGFQIICWIFVENWCFILYILSFELCLIWVWIYKLVGILSELGLDIHLVGTLFDLGLDYLEKGKFIFCGTLSHKVN
jgi:hypothetical protein